MKRLFFLTAAAAVFLCACGQKEEDLGNSYIFGEDYQYYFDDSEAFAESEDSYYFHGGEYLFAKDKKTGETSILCNKPDCLHDHETDLTRVNECNAWYAGFQKIQYYHGKLYILSSEPDKSFEIKQAVYETDTSGTTREKLFEIEKPVGTMLVHRGYVYITTSDFMEDPEVYKRDEEKKKASGYRVERYNLSKKSKKPEVILEKTGEYGQINEMTAYGNYIYMRLSSDGSAPDLVYNLQSKKVENMKTDVYGNILPIGGKLLFYEQLDDSVTEAAENFWEAYRSQKAVWAELDGTVTGEFELPFEPDIYTNGELIVTDNWLTANSENTQNSEHEFKIYDTNGNLLKTIKFDERFWFAGINEDYIFYTKEPAEEIGLADYEIWTIDLSRLDDETLEGEQFFAYVNPTGMSGIVIE